MVIHVILVVYIVLACVMMLNMLIAMLNNTYERIQDNCDMEWKFARSALLKVRKFNLLSPKDPNVICTMARITQLTRNYSIVLISVVQLLSELILKHCRAV